MKINNREHFKQKWIAHDLLSDFHVEDVWQFPVKLQKKHSIPLFQNEMFNAMEQLSKEGLPGILFKLRFFLGGIFGWDKPHPVPDNGVKKGSIRERYAKKFKLNAADLIPIGNAEFEPVYVNEEESLAEIANATVHAGLHLYKIKKEEEYKVQMAVYVKPKGLLGKFYMALIKPFRTYIVYPAMMRIVKNHWDNYLVRERQKAT